MKKKTKGEREREREGNMEDRRGDKAGWEGEQEEGVSPNKADELFLTGVQQPAWLPPSVHPRFKPPFLFFLQIKGFPSAVQRFDTRGG